MLDGLSQYHTHITKTMSFMSMFFHSHKKAIKANTHNININNNNNNEKKASEIALAAAPFIDTVNIIGSNKYLIIILKIFMTFDTDLNKIFIKFLIFLSKF